MISAVAVTVMPSGVAAVCLRSSAVPTEVSPSSRKMESAAAEVSSISAAIAGVAKTGREPLFILQASLSSVTVVERV